MTSRFSRAAGRLLLAALDAALAPPSGGVVFWSWPPLSEDRAKQEVVSRRAR